MVRSGGGGGSLRLPLILFLVVAPGIPAGAAEGRFLFDVQPTYLTGDFGDPGETDIYYLPLEFKYRTPRLDLRATIPYLRVTTSGPGTTDARFFQFLGGAPPDEVSGLGDVVLRGEWFFVQGSAPGEGRRPWVSAAGRLKLPTAESDALGTGEPDAGAGLGFLQPAGRWSLFAFGEYTRVGDPPGIDLRDTVRVDAGAGFAPRPESFLYFSFYNRNSIVRGRDDITDVAFGWNRRLNPRVRLLTAAYVGLSESAEDFGFSAGLSLRD